MKLWVTAAGTGSAWHICNIAKKYFADEIELFVSDINEPYLVAASTLADHYFVVPPVKEPGYADHMYRLLQENEIDVIIPLIPWEQSFFSMDREEFRSLGMKSIAPDQNTNDLLNNKVSLHRFCVEQGIPTIAIMKPDDIKPEATYFVKPLDGFGAMGTRRCLGAELTAEDFSHALVQEYCGDEQGIREITVEAFYHRGELYTIARRRLEAKSGVCTKAEIMDAPFAKEIMEKMVQLLPFPPVFNVQFIEHGGVWKVMDVNLRLAAGTGLSNAAGFQLIRALLASLLGKEVMPSWLQPDYGIKSILRVYEEVVIR